MIVYKCNVCGIEIPRIKKMTILGEIEALDLGFLKCTQIQIPEHIQHNPNVHLCKTCAEKQSKLIDDELIKLKSEMLLKGGGSMQQMREQGMTFQEIGDNLGISKQRVHQLLKKESELK